MSPPELARDDPVANVLHPVEERLFPIVGDEADAAIAHSVHGFRGERLRFHKPLRGHQRLHDGSAAIALADGQRVRIDLFEHAEFFEIGNHGLAGGEAIETRVGSGVRGHARIFADHSHVRQIVTLPCFEIVRIVRRSHLHDARAEFRDGQFIEDDGNLAIHERQHDGLAGQVAVALIFRIHSHGGIAQHGFRSRGGYHQRTRSVRERIANVPQVAVDVLMLHFEIGQRGVAARAPVHHVSAAINQTALVHADERFGNGAR